MIIDLLLITFFMLVSAVLSGAEAAFLTVSDIRIKTLMQKGDRHALLLHELRNNMHRLLGVLSLGQVISDIAASSIATVAATRYFGSFGVGIATGIMTVLVLVFGQILPKSFGARQPERWSMRLVRPVAWLIRLFSPPLAIIDWLVTKALRREFKFEPQHVVSEDEIKTMASLGVEAGTLERDEKEMIERVFLFNDINASDVMTPKENVVFLDGAKPLADALPVINGSNYSRFPIFGNDKNDIIGIVHIKDIFQKLTENRALPVDKILIRELAEPAPFVPRKKHLDDLLRDMQKQHVHMAIVVNEFGSVDGVVTFEDLLEELVGEISDESDVDELTIKRIDKLNIVVHGDAEIKDVNRFFNVRLDAPPYKSVAWMILKEVGSIPVKGQQVKIGANVTATVEEMLNLRINRVRLTKTEDILTPVPDAAR